MAVCLLALVCPWIAAEEKPRVYTNDDLDRLAPLRGQTGVLSEPSKPSPSPRAAVSKDSGRDERYWRQQADRAAEQVRRLREQAMALAEKVDELRHQPGVQPYSDPRVRALEQKRQALEERAREAESRLEERARRAGAMPGWLR
jgi:hypothetical protein